MNKLLVGGIIVVVTVAILGLTFAGYIPFLSQLVISNQDSDAFNEEAEHTLKVATDVMEPAIKSGATISYKDIDFESLEVGDIIIFKHEPVGFFVTRIIEITPDGLKTQADQNRFPDSSPITPSIYVGKVVNIYNP